MTNNLYISIFIDNDASMKKHMSKLNAQLNGFIDKVKNLDIELEIISYGDLEPSVFESAQISEELITLNDGCIPLLSSAIQKGHQNLLTKVKNQKPNHRSWFILLTNGRSLESIEDSVNQLRNDSDLDVFFLPIALQKFTYSKIFTNLRETFKRPITLTNYQFDKLFDWLSTLLQERLSKPQEEKLKLSKDQLEGWAYL